MQVTQGKFLLLFFVLCFFFQHGNSQDSLVYRNGAALAVEIVSISQDNKLIQVKSNDKELVISFQVLARYKFQNQWVNLPEVESTALYPYEVKDKLINRTFLTKRSGLSIGTNLSALIAGKTNKDYQRLPYSIRPLLTIEPEYRLANKENISLKASLEFGLPFPEVSSGPNLSSGNAGYSFYNGIVVYSFYDNTLQNANVYQYGERFKGCYIPFRTSLTVKLWPSDYLRERFYLSLGVILGVADYHAVTVYDSFESSLDDWGNTVMKFVGQTSEVQKNPFFFARIEYGTGYHFQLSKNYSLNLEGAVSRRIYNKGKLPDVVYARVDNQEYTKMYEGVFTGGGFFDAGIFDNILFRLRFFYHFTK